MMPDHVIFDWSADHVVFPLYVCDNTHTEATGVISANGPLSNPTVGAEQMPEEMITRTLCERCGVVPVKRAGSRFCSRSCGWPKIQLACPNCHAAISAGVRKLQKIFCDRACFRQFQSANSPKRLPEYKIWEGMIGRCHGKKPSPNYKGRGISVCDEWRTDFFAFLNHVGERPSEFHSIDRIDNDGDYVPGNVRWATRLEQSLNTRRTQRFDFGGASLTLLEWAKVSGRSYQTLRSRIIKLGWTVERAIMDPPQQSEFPGLTRKEKQRIYRKRYEQRQSALHGI